MRGRRPILPACRPPSSIAPSNRAATMHVSRKVIALALLALLAGFAASEEEEDYGSGPLPTDDYSYDYDNGDLEQFMNDLLGSLGLSEGQMTECQNYFSSADADAADTACGDVLSYAVDCPAACSKWISGIPDFCTGFFAIFVQSANEAEIKTVVDTLNNACGTNLEVTLPAVVPGDSPTASPDEEPPSPSKVLVSDVEVEAGDSTVVFKVVSDPTAVSKDLPILFLLPAWNVPVEQYSSMAEGLASRGYFVVGASVPTTLPSNIEGCPDEQLVPSAAALTLFAKNADLFAEALGPKAGAKPEVVLLGQGSGGWAALLAASGACKKKAADPQAAALCEGFDGFGGSIKGAVVSDIALSDPETAAFKLSDAFSLFMVGDFDDKNATRLAYEGTTSDCSGFVQLSGANPYSWNDLTNGQLPNCTSVDAGASLFIPTEKEQAATVDLVATIVDSATRASLLGDSEAAAVLGRLGDNKQVVSTEGLACFAALE